MRSKKRIIFALIGAVSIVLAISFVASAAAPNNATTVQVVGKTGVPLSGSVTDAGFVPSVVTTPAPGSTTATGWILADGGLATVSPSAPLPTKQYDYPVMRRDTTACVSATWGLVDGGTQGNVLQLPDGGYPQPGVKYACTATTDGCFGQGAALSTCTFAATIFGSSLSFESFINDPNDAGAPVPQVHGLGLNGPTTFTCCPYVAQ
jgi:hypothetical protein